MRFSSFIDNVTSKEWQLTIQQAYLFDWIYSLPSWAEKVMVGNEVYFYASRNKAIEELPILTDKPDTMYRYYKQLEELGLIVLKKIDGKDFIGLTDKSKKWNSVGKKSEYSEKNPSNVGKKSETDSEKNPTYNTTNTDKLTNDHELLVWPSFDDFWTAYDKKLDRKSCEKKWSKITQSDREKIMHHVPLYVTSTPNKDYRKNPETYLNKKSWENEIINGTNQTKSGIDIGRMLSHINR